MGTADREELWVAAAREAMQAEAEAIETAAGRLNQNLSRAVGIILDQNGKVVTTGIGKSGHVARKLAATLCSTGTPAVFLHPAEAVHGDLGVYSPGDPTVIISKSGATDELLKLVPTLREFRSPIIGILGNPASPLATMADVVLDASVRREVDPNNLAPTSSSVVALSLGDALTVALIHARSVSAEEFGRLHPGGRLGSALRLRVRDAMHTGEEVAWAGPEDPVKDVIAAMTLRPLGAACVVGEDGALAGLVTDGDLRRAMRARGDIHLLRAREVMTVNPVTIGPDARLADALERMENRPSQISVLPVVDAASGRCLGLVRLHDLYRAQAR